MLLLQSDLGLFGVIHDDLLLQDLLIRLLVILFDDQRLLPQV